MIRLVPIVLALAAARAAGGVEYAPVAGAPLMPDSMRTEGFRVDVEDGGHVVLPDREVVTIRGLEYRLRLARLEFEARHEAARGVLCDLPVVLHVDRKAPWHHVQLVMQTAARVGCARVLFAVGGDGAHVLDARLPMGFERAQGDGAKHTFCFFAIEPVGQAERPWPGGGDVMQPARVGYALGGGDEPIGLEELRKEAAALAAARPGETDIRVVFRVPPRTPFGFVAEAMTAFDRKAFPALEFRAPPPQFSSARGRRLPFPPESWTGEESLESIGAWAPRGRDNAPTTPYAGGAVDPDVRPPLAPGAIADRDVDRAGRVVVNLTGNGCIRIGDTQYSLRALLRYLGAVVHPDATRAPPRVLLRVDGDAPWQHTMHLLTALVRAEIPAVEFAIRRRGDRADDERTRLVFGVDGTDTEPDPARDAAYFPLVLRRSHGSESLVEALAKRGSFRRNSLTLTAEREVESTFGPDDAPARRPLNVRFRWNDRETYSFVDLLRRIHEQRALSLRDGVIGDLANSRVIVSVSEKVPSAYAIAALARIHELGWREIYVFEALPQEDERLLAGLALPYPETNRAIAGFDGIRLDGDEDE